MGARGACRSPLAARSTVAGLALLAACTTTPADGTASRAEPRRLPPPSANEHLVATGGQFVVTCAPSHAAPDDPIVHPDHPGLSHLHEFFGNRTTSARSRPRSLLSGPTTCDHPGDRAAYWAPALLVDGRPVRPTSSDAYYRVAPGVDPASVEPFPLGLAMVAGDAAATQAQPTSTVGWACGRRPGVSATVPTCPAGSPVSLRVTFPDCWDGEHLDSLDHDAHVASSGRRGCPPSHPVALPLLTFVVHYPLSGAPGDVRLASGPPQSAHADFLNAWVPADLAREVRACLQRDVVCGIAPGTLGSTFANA